MPRLTIAPTNDHLLADGKPFFYCADTDWSVFANASIDEARELFEYRRNQGFNTVQLSVLAQWDRSESDFCVTPWALKDDGFYDYTKFNESYFERAEEIVALAASMGLTSSLHVLWCDVVPDNWLWKRNNEKGVMPLEVVEMYSEVVAKRFGKYDPVFVISGDTSFDGPRALQWYMTCLKIIKKHCPDSLASMHICGGLTNLPQELEDDPDYQIYMYQSGHAHDQNGYRMASEFFTKKLKRPTINTEPCYEAHAHFGMPVRWTAFDVRRASWQSILSGAKAGITYGAHGIWSWHRTGKTFKSDASSIPFHWREALRLPGAWDITFLKALYEMFDLFDIEPSDQLESRTQEERLSMSPDKSKVVLYTPWPCDVTVKVDPAQYEWRRVDLAERRFAKPRVEAVAAGALVKMAEATGDSLVFGVKK